MKKVWMLELFSILFAGLSAGVSACEQQKSAVVGCADTLATAFRQRLESRYGLSNVTTEDLQNSTVLEYATRSTRDVVCDATNQMAVDCLIDNLTLCETLVQDEDFRSRPLGYVVSMQWNTINASTSVCDGMGTAICNVLKTKFQNCYSELYSLIIDNRELTREEVCQPQKYTAIQCVIDIVSECPDLVNDGVPDAVRNRILGDEWNYFTNATHLCDCYHGVECWLSAEFSVDMVTANVGETPREIYSTALKLAETICRNEENLLCAYERIPSCKVLRPLFENQGNIVAMHSMANNVCYVIDTNVFRENKECVLNRLTDSFHPCIVKARVPKSITKCSDLQSIYSCLHSALQGHCDGDLTNAVFALVRGDLNKIKDCDVTSGAKSFDLKTTTQLVLILLTVAALNILGLF